MRETTPYLDPGERFKAGFAVGRTASAVVVATDRRLLVFASTMNVVIKVKGLITELPVTTRFGTPRGALYQVPQVPPGVVGRAWFFGVREVDAALAAMAGESPEA
jgi:hypothetical protein